MPSAIIRKSELRSAKWSPGPGTPGLFHSYITRIRDLTVYAIAIKIDEEPADKSVLVINGEGKSAPLIGPVAVAIYDLARESAHALMN